MDDLCSSNAGDTPPWSRGEGRYLVNFRGMLPDSGSILAGFHFWEVQFVLMVSPGWINLV